MTAVDFACCAGCDCGTGCLPDCMAGPACPDASTAPTPVARTYGTGDSRGHVPLTAGATRAVLAVTVPADTAAEELAVIVDRALVDALGGAPDTTAWAGVDDFLTDFKAGLVHQRTLPVSIGDRTAIVLDGAACCGLRADDAGTLITCGSAATRAGYTAGGWWPHCDTHALPTDLTLSAVRRDPDSLGYLADVAEP